MTPGVTPGMTPGVTPPPAYHHGNLRRALLDAAWEIADSQGVEAVSLRAVARRAGVSHAAPHHHFPDKAALVEALAVEGYDRFTEALAAAGRERPGNALDRMGAVGMAYVLFAHDHTPTFRLMNRPELRTAPGDTASPVAQAAGRAFAVLTRAIEDAQAAGLVAHGDSQPWALMAWSGVHGLAMLSIDGLLAPLCPHAKPDVAAITRTMLLAMGAGLFVRRPDDLPAGLPDWAVS